MDQSTSFRLGSLTLFFGVVTLIVATLFHPFSFDPRNAEPAFSAGASRGWVVDHWILVVGTVLVGVGMAVFHYYITSFAQRDSSIANGGVAHVIAPFLGMVSFAIWVLLFAFEATGWATWAGMEGAAARVLAEGAWPTLLGTGYVAGILAAVAVYAWALEACRASILPPWTKYTAWVSVVWVIGTTPIAWSYPEAGVPMIAPGYALIALWMMVAASALWRA